MIKVQKITIKHIIDESPDLSYLGEFSNTAGNYAIEHNGERGTYPYFNADNVENMEDAQQNYDRMMQFEKGDVYCIGIKAIAEVHTSENGNTWLINHIESGGLWGIESDSDAEYLREVEQDELHELRKTLKAFGLIDEAINAAKVETKTI